MPVFTWANGDSLSSVRTKIINKLSPIIDVKADFGAVGDGVADDTAEIQAAFDAAYGAPDSPNGTTNPHLNKIVFFPPGNYLVSQPTAMTVSGAADNGSGLIRLTVNSTANLRTNHIVTVSGITGTISGFANGVFGIVVIDSTHIDLRNTSGFTGTYTSGGAVNRAALQLNGRGVHLMGTMRFASRIQAASGSTILAANGLDYSVIENLTFDAGGASLLLDLNWDNTTPTTGQSVTVRDCFFQNGNQTSGSIGVRLGYIGYQVSEIIFINNFFANADIGLYVKTQNTLQVSVFGGNFQSCVTAGIEIDSAGVTRVDAVGFQNNTTCYDVKQLQPATEGDACVITGCRTESKNFVSWVGGSPLILLGNGQRNSGNGDFFSGTGGVCMFGNHSESGRIVFLTNNSAQLAGALNQFSGGISKLVQNQGGVATAISTDFFYTGTDSSGNQLKTFATLPTAHATLLGARVLVTDSTTATVGNTITGGGSNKVMAICDSSPAWKVERAL